MDAGVLLQAVLTGLASGAVLGLVALGFTLVAGTVRVLHLAHGDVVVGAVLLAVLAVVGATPVAGRLDPLPGAALVVLALAAGALLAAAVLLLAVRPHLPDPARGRAGDPLGWLAGTVAVGLLVREGLALALPAQGYVVPDPLRLPAGVLDLPGGAVLPARVPAVLVLALPARSPSSGCWCAPASAPVCGPSPTTRTRPRCAAYRPAGSSCRSSPWPACSPGSPGCSTPRAARAVRRQRRGARPVRHRRRAARRARLARGAVLGGLGVGLLQALVVTAVGARLSDVVPLAVLVLLLAAGPRACAAAGARVSALDLATALWLLVAPGGLALSVSCAGLPVLGQAAFVAVGGFGTALLGPGGAGWPLGLAALASTALAGLLGLLVALGASRLQGAYLALGTFALGWLVERVLTAYPGVFGGAQGLVRPVPAELVSPALGLQVALTPAVHVVLAGATSAVLLAALHRLDRGPGGLDLAALREGPASPPRSASPSPPAAGRCSPRPPRSAGSPAPAPSR